MNSKPFRMIILVCVISCLTLFSSCGKQEAGWKGFVEKREGMTIIKNPGHPLNAEAILHIEEDMAIGQQKAMYEDLFSHISAIDVDDDNNIYILDDAESRIQVFSPDGRFVRTIGRKGQGPGEMERPFFLQITAQSEVFVYDIARSRAVYYSRDGTFIRQKSVGRTLRPVRLDSRGYLIGIEALAPPPLGGRVLNMYDQNFRWIMTIAREEQGQRMVLDVGKPAFYACGAKDDQIIWGNSEDYSFYILNSKGEPIRIIQKDYDPVSITPLDKREQEERYAEPIKLGMRISFRRHFPAFSGIFVDEAGRVFIKTYERAEGGQGDFYFDVFNSEGLYTARVTINANLNERSVWKKDKLFTIETDELDLQKVVRYRVNWKD